MSSVLFGTKLSTLPDEILIDEAPVPARVEPHAVRVAAFSEAVVKQMMLGDVMPQIAHLMSREPVKRAMCVERNCAAFGYKSGIHI